MEEWTEEEKKDGMEGGRQEGRESEGGMEVGREGDSEGGVHRANKPEAGARESDVHRPSTSLLAACLGVGGEEWAVMRGGRDWAMARNSFRSL